MHDAAKKMNSPSQTPDNRSVNQTNEYPKSSAHALIPKRSLFEVLQAYDAKMIPTNIQKLEDELRELRGEIERVKILYKNEQESHKLMLE